MCTVIDLEHQSLAVERPTTRRRPFAMNIDESGNELLLSESSAPESGSMAQRQGDHERPKIPISRPRSAPPADKMAAPDGACLRSQSARARPRHSTTAYFTAAMHAPVGTAQKASCGRPRTAMRRDGASPKFLQLPRFDRVAPATEDTSNLGVRLLILAFIYLSESHPHVEVRPSQWPLLGCLKCKAPVDKVKA